MRPFYVVQTQPGFEAIAAQEIEQRLERVALRGTRRVGDKNGIVLFEYDGPPQKIFDLRTIEDLFVVVATIADLPRTFQGLQVLERAVSRAATVEAALNLARQVKPGRKIGGKVRFRVITRQLEQAAYRRVDAQQAVERGFAARADYKWRLENEGAIEFWLTLFPGEALLALRLSDEQMRHRDYKLEHLPASLRPSAAAALVWLTQPVDDDVFLDPMCGAGTILIERATIARYQLLLGGDIRSDAVAVALRNIGPRYKPITVRQWDVRSLPIESESVSAAAVNLPFGKQIGTPGENRELYTAFLKEMVRVLRPAARLVALTSDQRAFMFALQRGKKLKIRDSYNVQLLGQFAKIYVMQRL
ncbi:MAG TPA: hypothetical protein VFZ66_10220 [Herpetosiphonaceae bacterium]